MEKALYFCSYTKMPSSNPLPPKENALFKRILVSNGRSKYSVLDPTLRLIERTHHALMIKHSLGKTRKSHWRPRNAAPCLALRIEGRFDQRYSATIDIADLAQTRNKTHRIRVETNQPPIYTVAYYIFFVFLTEMLRTQTIQKWVKVRKTDPVESKV